MLWGTQSNLHNPGYITIVTQHCISMNHLLGNMWEDRKLERLQRDAAEAAEERNELSLDEAFSLTWG